jgi:subtilisin family serine protease
MLRSLFSAVLTVMALFGWSGKGYSQQNLADFKRAGAVACIWKDGQGDNAVKAVEALGFRIVFRGPLADVLTCEWNGELTAKALDDLKKLDTLEGVEPAWPLVLLDEPKKDGSMEKNSLDAFEWAGAMACVWKEGKRAEALKLIADLKLEKIFVGELTDTITCKWKPPLKMEVLEALKKSDALEYVEPAPDIKLVQAAQGRTIELEQGTPQIRAAGNRLGCYPDDPDFKKLWGMESINAPQAWCYAKTTDKIVAVIDSGIDFDHPDIKPNMWLNPAKGQIYKTVKDDVHGVDYTVLQDGFPTANVKDGFGHGTHVSGTIGAVGNNKIGVVGVNWRVQLMALKVFDDQGKGAAGRTPALAEALAYARKAKAKVISLSLRWDDDSGAVAKQIGECEKEGILIVCAAGNDSNDNDKKPQFPASYTNSNILAVAALNINNQLAGFSNFGATKVHLAAPGEDVFSTVPIAQGQYGSKSGTSMATPHVSGAAALIWGQPKYASFDHKQIKALIVDNARKLAVLSGKCISGGTLDIAFLNPEPPSKNPVPPVTPPPVYITCPPPIVYYPCPPHRPIFYRFRCGRR